MRLIKLEPEFLRVEDELTWRKVDAITEADGVMFTCPKCDGHRVICWSPRVPRSIGPRPGRWELRGNGFSDLTLSAGSSSVSLPCGAHFFITGGEIINA